jgi:hypothetical protein
MPEKLSEFLKDVASAKAKGDAADAEIISKLKNLSPEDFARIPRDVLGTLSAAQYADVVSSIAPDVKLKAAPIKTASEQPYKRKLRDYVTWIPIPVVAVVVSIAIGMAILAAAISTSPALEWWSYSKPLSLPVYVAEWPRCPRLTRWTDGCVYHVTKGLSWRDAAGYLGVSESYFRHINRHITDDSIPAGADLTVWRERFLLRESR